MSRIKENVPLAPLTTFRIGGPARYFVTIKSIMELKEALAFARSENLPVFVLGGGSNILVSDNGFPGLVIKMELKDTEWRGDGQVTAGAGALWDRLVAQAGKRGLSGIENLSLIPGTVGGAVYQNIGAYGAELKDVLSSVLVLDQRIGKVRILTVPHCRFGYRDSVFKRPEGEHFVILSATLRLSKNFVPDFRYPDLAKYFERRQPTLAAVRRAVIAIRRRKLVYPTATMGSAGSFFENPVVSPAQWGKLSQRFSSLKAFPQPDGRVKLAAGQLIELAGLKGHRRRSVGVSDKHALVLVNYGGGKERDISRLASTVVSRVHRKFGIILKPEAEFV